MISKLIERIRIVNSQPENALAAQDQQGQKLSEFFRTGDGRNFGCQLNRVRALTELLLGRPLPAASAGSDEYVGQLRVVVVTATHGGYQAGYTAVAIRPVNGKGRGRGFNPSQPDIREPLRRDFTRPAASHEIMAFVSLLQTSESKERLVQWLADGDWSVASIQKLANGHTVANVI